MAAVAHDRGVAVRSWVKAVAVWIAILALAIFNGVLRESLLIPMLGLATGLVSSGVMLSAMIIAAAWCSIRWLGVESQREAWHVGLLWLVLTLVFEFGFGVLQGKSWSELLQAYTFSGGNIWPVVLAVTVISPAMAYRMRVLR